MSLYSGVALHWRNRYFLLSARRRNGASSGVGEQLIACRLSNHGVCVLPRAAAAAVLWSVAGRDELSILSVVQTVPRWVFAVALRGTGPLAVALFSSRRPVDFILECETLADSCAAAVGRKIANLSRRSCRGRVGIGILAPDPGCLYSYRPASRRRSMVRPR